MLKSEIIKQLNLKNVETNEELIVAIQKEAWLRGIRKIALADSSDTNDVLSIHNHNIKVLEYTDDHVSHEEIYNDLKSGSSNVYRISTGWILEMNNFHNDTFKVIDFDPEDNMFLVECREDKVRSVEPYEYWVHYYDLRIVK